eukprot:2600838-Ditylum_brightwellii.AAC.1
MNSVFLYNTCHKPRATFLLGSTGLCVAHMQWATAAPCSTTAHHAVLSSTSILSTQFYQGGSIVY